MPGHLSLNLLLESIKQVYEAAGRDGVAVHCRNGANRSPAWMVCYVMAATQVTPDEALDHVSRLRISK